MTDDVGARAAELLIDQAWADYEEGRYQASVAAAARGQEAARLLDDPVLLVRALSVESFALKMMGDFPAALAGFTRILGLAQDPASRGRLDDPGAVREVAAAHWGWTECARSVSGIPARELFGVLDAAERWLAATGHRDWRAAILMERASTHSWLGERDAAVAVAEEALAVALQYPDNPGFSLDTYRYFLAEMLCNAGRAAEALPHYQAILADPGASPWSRCNAHTGLGYCALAAGDLETAPREAHTGVLLAESLGDNALTIALDVLVKTCLAAGDLEAAWQAASRYLEAAGRVGGHVRPYYAVRAATDVALDRADFATVRRLLAELDEHAAALDASTGSTVWTREAATRRQRLADEDATAGGEDPAPVPDDRQP